MNQTQCNDPITLKATIFRIRGLHYDTRSQYDGFNDLVNMKGQSDRVKIRLARRDEEGDLKGWKLKEQL